MTQRWLPILALASILAGAILAAVPVRADRVLASGTIRDREGGVLPGASVYLRGTRLLTLSDSEGEWTLRGAISGSVVLVVTMPGFQKSSPSGSTLEGRLPG